MNDLSKVETALIMGDLSKLNDAERLSYYQKVCDSLGLNPFTKPFDYIQLNGKTVLYATRTATDQIRNIYKVSLKLIEKKVVNDCYVVTAQATLPDGRIDESSGAVNITGLKGDSYANAIMKAETKAKRRVTLSACGLGMLDESELDTIQEKTVYPPPPPQQQQQAQIELTKEDPEKLKLEGIARLTQKIAEQSYSDELIARIDGYYESGKKYGITKKEVEDAVNKRIKDAGLKPKPTITKPEEEQIDPREIVKSYQKRIYDVELIGDGEGLLEIEKEYLESGLELSGVTKAINQAKEAMGVF